MFIREGASKALKKDERRAFLEEQWPEVVATIRRLGLDPSELLAEVRSSSEEEG
jgi:GntR family transcriptional regulator